MKNFRSKRLLVVAAIGLSALTITSTTIAEDPTLCHRVYNTVVPVKVRIRVSERRAEAFKAWNKAHPNYHPPKVTAPRVHTVMMHRQENSTYACELTPELPATNPLPLLIDTPAVDLGFLPDLPTDEVPLMNAPDVDAPGTELAGLLPFIPLTTPVGGVTGGGPGLPPVSPPISPPITPPGTTPVAAQTPEPGTLLLTATALVLGFSLRRRSSQRARA